MDCDSEGTESAPVYVHILLHYNISCIVGRSPLRLAAVDEIGYEYIAIIITVSSKNQIYY